jgi:hypothetical protein
MPAQIEATVLVAIVEIDAMLVRVSVVVFGISLRVGTQAGQRARGYVSLKRLTKSLRATPIFEVPF